MLRRLPALLALTLAAALVALIMVSADEVRGALLNSDHLQMHAYIDDLLHHPGTVAQFQLPRIPSIFPDALAAIVLSLALPDWRLVAVSYAVLSFVALVFTAGAITAQIAGRRIVPGATAFFAIATLAIAAPVALRLGSVGTLFILLPIVHSGSLLASFWGLLLARRHLAKPGAASAILLVADCALGTLSDQLFVGTCLLPLLAATATSCLRPPMLPGVPRQHLLAVAALATLACAAGWGADRLLFARYLLRAPNLPIDLGRQALLVHDRLIHDPLAGASLACAALALALPLVWIGSDRSFWQPASAAAVLGPLVLLPLVYADESATRYVQPVWWWAAIMLSAAMLRAAPRATPVALPLLAAASCAALATLRPDALAPGLVTRWHDPLAVCIAAWRGQGAIHDGLAEYWTARPIEASSDWTLHVAQIDGDGGAFLWNNNRASYASRRASPDGPPRFDFVIMHNLDPSRIARRFGPPDHILVCPGASLWSYAGQLRPRIGGQAGGQSGTRLAFAANPGISPAVPAGVVASAPAMPIPGRHQP